MEALRRHSPQREAASVRNRADGAAPRLVTAVLTALLVALAAACSSQSEPAEVSASSGDIRIDGSPITVDSVVCDLTPHTEDASTGPEGVEPIYLVSARGYDDAGTWYLVHLASTRTDAGNNEQVAVDRRPGPEQLGDLYEAFTPDGNPRLIERDGSSFRVDLTLPLLETAGQRIDGGGTADSQPSDSGGRIELVGTIACGDMPQQPAQPLTEVTPTER